MYKPDWSPMELDKISLRYHPQQRELADDVFSVSLTSLTPIIYTTSWPVNVSDVPYSKSYIRLALLVPLDWTNLQRTRHVIWTLF